MITKIDMEYIIADGRRPADMSPIVERYNKMIATTVLAELMKPEGALEEEDDAVMGETYKELSGFADSTEDGYTVTVAIAAFNMFGIK